METFNEAHFDYLYEVEEKHFWFIGRNWIIWSILSPMVTSESRMVEIGCGNGKVTSFLKSKGVRIAGGDLYERGLRFCRSRGIEELYRVDVTSLPFKDSWDIIGIFDTIEHIEDDALAIKNLYEALKEGGHLILTVPAYKFLWGSMDEVARHKRRYTRREIVEKLQTAGFSVKRASYFMTFLFPLLAFIRAISKKDTSIEGCENLTEMKIIPFVNGLFKFLMKLEAMTIRWGDLPFGSSIIVMAQRKG